MGIFAKRPPQSAPEVLPEAILTRRTFWARLAGAAAASGLGAAPAALSAAPQPALDPALRDAALRGLALAGYRGDPVTAAAAKAALAGLARADPEAAILGQLYQLLDVRPCAFSRLDLPDAAEQDLAALHEAIAACRPVAFGYTDLSANQSERRVLPLTLVHPPQGVKLLAWCETRKGFRQFFVREMTGLALRPGDFSADRVALLAGLLDKETGRDDDDFPIL